MGNARRKEVISARISILSTSKYLTPTLREAASCDLRLANLLHSIHLAGGYGEQGPCDQRQTAD